MIRKGIAVAEYAPAREYQPVGYDAMQASVREGLAALGMPDLDVTGETRWKTPPVWLLWLPGRGVPPNESLGCVGLVATLGDGSDGFLYADLRHAYGTDGYGDGSRQGEAVSVQNAGYPPCPGDLWNTRYPRTAEGMEALRADVAAARARAESVLR